MMGKVHARAAAHCGATVIAIADGDHARARGLASSLGISSQTFEVSEVIARDDVDVVHICAPPNEHFPLCEQSLSMGRSVLCEKPVAPTAGEVKHLVMLAEQRDVAFCPVHQFPFQRGVSDVLRAKDVLGSVVHLSAEMCTAGADGKGPREMMTLSLDIVTHAFSLFRKFGVDSLERVEWSVLVPQGGDLLITGVSAGIGLSAHISTMGRPASNLFRVIGTGGTATIDLYHGFSVVEEGTVSRARKAARPFISSAATFAAAAANGISRALSAETGFPGLRNLVGVFYDAVEKKAAAPISPGEIVDIAMARDSVIALSRERFPAQ
jgi:predicted dehydrogenase